MRSLNAVLHGFPLPVLDLPEVRNRILVVDDDPGIRAVFEESLRLARFDVIVAHGGAEGLHLLRTDPSIGLVLLDLMMPEMDGWRFRHAQRTDSRLASIPTVVVSGSPLRNIVHEELGAADYLLKPVSREHLLSVARTYVRPEDDEQAAAGSRRRVLRPQPA
jgi:CheY-like chemotaxis protein